MFTIVFLDNKVFRLNNETGATWMLHFGEWIHIVECKESNDRKATN